MRSSATDRRHLPRRRRPGRPRRARRGGDTQRDHGWLLSCLCATGRKRRRPDRLRCGDELGSARDVIIRLLEPQAVLGLSIAALALAALARRRIAIPPPRPANVTGS